LSPNRDRVTTVLIQDRVRLFRESLRVVLDQDPGIEVIDTVASPDALDRTVLPGAVDVVVLEAAGVGWDTGALIGRLEAARPGVRIVGTVPPGSRHATLVGVSSVLRTAPGSVFVGLVDAGAVAPSTESPAAGVGAGTPGADLTQREVQVLALISRGHTTRQIAARLGISAKTVESRRQSLFAKLGVQSQAHAVAVGIRSGIIGHRPEVVGPGPAR
jgi:DNA-binding NarL/FixJ family response regulator